MSLLPSRGGALFALMGVVSLLALTGCHKESDVSSAKGGPLSMRRLTEAQYRQIIADLFGSTIEIAGRFDLNPREDGMLAVGASKVGVTATGLEQYDFTARSVAAQIVDPKHRGMFVPCRPRDEARPDEDCARKFLGKVGRLLYRRPVAAAELDELTALAGNSAATLGDFYGGLQAGLASMLVSPRFLFRLETAEVDVGIPGRRILEPYSKAQRLSFFLWNSAPDIALLDAAERGELETSGGIERQVERMVASPRIEAATRAFFSDMFRFDGWSALAKDATLYPKFTSDVPMDAQEQTLRTIVDLLIVEKGDYRDLFTTRKTYLTRALAAIYKVPIEIDKGWVAYEYKQGDPRSGIASQISFTALHSHPGRSSSTLRGRAVREIFLCQRIPDPPPNVNFALVQDTGNPNFKTLRQRMTAHRTEASCAGCHKLMDPVGLGLENFDTSGGYRTEENGAVIDASGEIDGLHYDTPAELGRALHDLPATSRCLVNRAFDWAFGRAPTRDERPWVDELEKQFAKGGYRWPDLMRMIASSEAFYRISTEGQQAKLAAANVAADQETTGSAGQ